MNHLNPKKILVIKLRSFGDTVIMTAPLEDLRKNYPNSKIDVLVTTQWAPILENNPFIDKIIPYTKKKETTARAKSLARLGFQLRKERYDVVINMHASPSSSMLAFATGAKVKSIHFHGHKDKNRYSTVIIPGKGETKPIIERDCDTLRALGCFIPNGLLPKIFITSNEKEKVAQYFKNENIDQPIIGFGIGSSRETKIWPLDRFASLAIRLIQFKKCHIAIFTGPDEIKLKNEFLNSFEDQIHLLGQDQKNAEVLLKQIHFFSDLNLRELSSILQQCQLFIGNDSGPRHLAVAVGTKTVTIIGPEHPYEWHPYPIDSHPYLFIENLSCRKDALPGMPPWCGLEVCTTERHQCMHLIRIEQVFEKCLKLLEKR